MKQIEHIISLAVIDCFDGDRRRTKDDPRLYYKYKELYKPIGYFTDINPILAFIKGKYPAAKFDLIIRDPENMLPNRFISVANIDNAGLPPNSVLFAGEYRKGRVKFKGAFRVCKYFLSGMTNLKLDYSRQLITLEITNIRRTKNWKAIKNGL